MLVEKRMKMIQMIEKLEKNKKFSEKIGVENRSHFKQRKNSREGEFKYV